jgi:hypothetical protein
MLNYEELKDKLKDRNLCYVSRKSGVSKDFLYRLVNGKVKRYPHEAHVLLNAYFEENK